MPGPTAGESLGTHLVIMGPAGCGKSSVAARLARAQGVPLAEGDDFHSDDARQKMAAGVPLTDDDRRPWLQRLATWMTSHAATGSVVSCSALRHNYRNLLRTAEGTITFIHLDLTRDQLQARLEARTDHFMPAALLDSQLQTLEPLRAGEGITIDGNQPIETIVDAIQLVMRSNPGQSQEAP